MKQKNQKRMGAILSAVGIMLYSLVALGLFGWLYKMDIMSLWLCIAFAVLEVAILVLIIVVMVQRLQEINKGEEDEARHY